MKQINLKDFKIFPIEESVKHETISDEQYFSNYGSFVSASKLHRISPKRGGSMDNYYNPKPMGFKDYLIQGSYIHEVILQPNEFRLIEAPCGKPSAKLGEAIDAIIKYRKSGISIEESINKGCDDVEYFLDNFKQRKKKLFTKDNLKYYFVGKNIPSGTVVPSDKSYDAIKAQINSVLNNPIIYKQLYPTDVFGDPLPTFPEDTIFKDFIVTYGDKCHVIHFRGKIDHWSIDPENKVLVLNDLKTSSDFLNNEWMNHHFLDLAYHMQFAIYLEALKSLAKKEYGFDDTWRIRSHCWALQTRGDAFSRCYTVSEELLKEGKEIYEDCMKRVAYYEMFGHDEEVEFIYDDSEKNSE